MTPAAIRRQYPFMSAMQRRSDLAADDLKLRFRTSEADEDKKTVMKVMKKKTVTKVIGFSSLVVTIQGIAKTITSMIRAVVMQLGRKATQLDFLRFQGTTSIPFNVLDFLVSAYSCYDDSMHAYKSYKASDHEGVQEHSINLSSSVINIGSIATGFTYLAYNINRCASQALAWGTASSILGGFAFGTFSVVQGAKAWIAHKACIVFKSIFTSDMSAEEKFKAGFDEMFKDVVITSKERSQHLLQTQASGRDYSQEIAKLAKRKHYRLVRRVGNKLAFEMEETYRDLKTRLESADAEVRREAIEQARDLMQRYRYKLVQTVAVRALKCIGGALGAVACFVSITNPVASGIIFGVSTAFLLYGWYLNKYRDGKQLSQVNSSMRYYVRYDIPTADEVMKSEAGGKREPSRSSVTDISEHALKCLKELAERERHPVAVAA